MNMTDNEPYGPFELAAFGILFAAFLVSFMAIPWMALAYWGPIAGAGMAILLSIVWGLLVGAPRPCAGGKVSACGWAIVILSHGAALVVSVCWLILLGVRMIVR